MTQRVLLTGISGFVGQHCGAELLRQGYEVVGTVRSTAKADVVKAGIATCAPIENLSFVELDLLADAGWDEAMQGIDHVLHVASPYFVTEPKDENEYIEPAVEGTKRVIAAAQNAGVKRMVLTSSTVAVSQGRQDGRYGSESWSDLDGGISTYAKSKTLAERAAWAAVEGGDMELVAINPGGIFGPTLSGRADGQSMMMVSDMINGKMPMLPDMRLGMVDVRDVARLHVAAITAEGAPGHRFIAATADPVDVVDLAKALKDAGFSKVSTRRAPTSLLKFVALFDKDVRGMLPMLGKTIGFDTRSTTEVLGWEPTPVDQSVIDTATSLTAA